MCARAEQICLWRLLKAALASDCMCLVPGVASYFFCRKRSFSAPKVEFKMLAIRFQKVLTGAHC